MKVNRYRVDAAAHRALPWRVHSLLADMRLEDVWRFPVELEADEDLQAFEAQLEQALGQTGNLGLAGLLLRLRLAVGRVLGWDGDAAKPPPRALYARYAASHGPDPAPPAVDRQLSFSPVYRFPDESLGEIENKTVLAAIHLSRVPLDSGRGAVHLAVYTLPKGKLGRAYMAAIKPFRLWIVYPAIMRAVTAHWERHRYEVG